MPTEERSIAVSPCCCHTQATLYFQVGIKVQTLHQFHLIAAGGGSFIPTDFLRTEGIPTVWLGFVDIVMRAPLLEL
jgi:hypothetical protein